MRPQAKKKSLRIKFPFFPRRRSSLTGSHTVLTHPWTCVLGKAATCWDRSLASVVNSDDFRVKECHEHICVLRIILTATWGLLRSFF